MAGLNRYMTACGAALVVLASGAHAQKHERQGQMWNGGQIFACDMPFFAPQIIQQTPSEQTQDGFIVAASGKAIEDTPAGKALELISQGKWVEAIQVIESLDDAEAGLVIDERGVLRPLSAMKSALIASMPEEGRRTFFKLNDPAANTKLAEALTRTDLEEQATAFKVIVDDYALCDAAAQAALRMGDIRFEQGRFSEAATYFHFAANHPATTADDPTLMARRLAALSRAEQWSAFDELAEYARFRHADTKITIAGQDAPLQAFITQLVESRGEVAVHRPANDRRDVQLPNATEFEYERSLIDENKRKLLQQLAMNNNLQSIIDQTLAPVVVSDGQRLFTLSMGQVTRRNPETGTELWQHGNLEEAVQAIQSRMHYLANGYHQSLELHGDTLLASIPDKQNISQSHLVAIDANTGQQKWTTRDMLRNTSESIVGKPLVVDDRIYFVSYKTNEDVILRAIDLNHGSEITTLILGKASKDQHMNTPAELSPRLTMGQGHLLVQTNNGALIAVDPNTMKVAWAYSQKIRPSGVAMMRRHGYAVANAQSRHTGEVVAAEGLVIAKDTRTNRVVAMREYDAAMIWQAEADPDSTIVHQDDKHIYLLGEELVALNLRTGERVWWTPHAGDNNGKPVFTDDACLIAGNQRLCRIDLATGKLTHFREDLANSADLHLVGQQLVSVTPEGIAALRLP